MESGSYHRQEALLRVFGKGSKERIVPVGSRARQALGDYLERSRPVLVKKSGKSEEERAFFLNLKRRKDDQQVGGEDDEEVPHGIWPFEVVNSALAQTFLCHTPFRRRG